MPADIPNGRLRFVNGTRQFKSVISYTCDTGHVLVGRSELRCDVDQRWNGPPPRCEPVYCDQPQPIRYGGFSLSTNSTRFGTVVTYYCNTNRHELVGPKKITCLKDGSYNADPPSCRDVTDKRDEEVVPLVLANPTRNEERRPVKDDTKDQYGVKRIRRPFRPGQQFPRDKFRPEVVEEMEVFSARPPIDNEIPDSSNVQNSAAGADVPKPVEGLSEERQAKLNLGKLQKC